jgi:hypothetical protein
VQCLLCQDQVADVWGIKCAAKNPYAHVLDSVLPL